MLIAAVLITVWAADGFCQSSDIEQAEEAMGSELNSEISQDRADAAGEMNEVETSMDSSQPR